jgi:hypothetical protein
VTVHPLAGTFSVEASARRIRHYRYAEERLMRALGGWVALTPELPAKIMFARHVWDCAQHADLWGRRLPELRAPAQQSEPSGEAFIAFMNRLESPVEPRQTLERLVGVYRVLKPHLVATYERHLAAANPVYEPPTRRILERCLEEERRHVAAGRRLLDRMLGGEPARRRSDECELALTALLAAASGVTGDTPLPPLAAALPSTVDPGPDLVALDSAFDPSVVAPDLRAAIEAHLVALGAGDWARLEADAAPEAWERIRPQYAGVVPCPGGGRIVAQARIGGYRLVKVRLAGARAAVLDQQWRPGPGGWRLWDVAVLGS